MSAATTIAVVTAVVGAGMSAAEAQKNKKAQEAANEAQRNINKLKNKQAKRAFLKNYRQQRANAYALAVAAGVGLESSVAQGARNTLLSQGQTAVQDVTRMDRLGGEITSSMNTQASTQFRANTWAQVSQFAASFIG